MQYKIVNIAISTKYGPHLQTVDKGEIKYLKGNHFDEDYQLQEVSDSYVISGQKVNQFLLTEDDVILAAKGHRNLAWSYEKKYGACIPSSLFYVIKVNQRKVLSQYLTICLNSPRFQYQLKLIGLGVTIPSIPKNELLRLKIELPSLLEQEKIVKIHALMQKQIFLEKKIVEKRKLLKRGLIDLITTN